MSEGPAPDVHERTTGQVAEWSVNNGEVTVRARVQFWVSREDGGECAPLYAWELGNESGDFGYFEGHGKRLWLGDEAATVEGTRYSFIELTEAWRDKLYWEDLFDRLLVAKRQYSFKQSGPLERANVSDIVSAPHRGPVYRSDIESYRSDEGTLLVQPWRADTTQAVFFATEFELDALMPPTNGTHGVMDQHGVLPDSIHEGVTLEEDARRTLLRQASLLRYDEVDGLSIA